MKVKIKKLHENAVIPSYGKAGDAGINLTSVSLEIDENGILTYDTGLAFEIPEGHYGMVALRSSVYKTDLMLTNHLGIVDSGYRGSVKFKFALTQQIIDFAREDADFDERLKKGQALFFPDERSAHWKIPHVAEVYKVGDRIGQMIIMKYPTIEFEEVDDLSETERGHGSYGHTGK